MGSTMKAYDKNIIPLLITVLCVAVRITYGQMYLITFGQNQRSYYNGDSVFNVHSYSTPDIYQNRSSYESDEISSENNSTTNTNNVLRDKSSESKMDLVTVVWYVATFIALATFFLLMTCPNRRGNTDPNNSNTNQNNRNESVGPPLTPTPSYSQFAPPSYESVMKAQCDDKTNIFYIPTNGTPCEIAKIYSTSTLSNNSNHSENIILPATVNFYIINEVGKI